MENAAKALGIAASVMIGVLLAVMLVMAYNKFTEIPKRNEQNAKTEQASEYNQRFTAYNKKNMKGNKLISLCNMIVDNNIKYKDIPDLQIEISVNMQDSDGNHKGEASFKISKEDNGASLYGDDYKSIRSNYEEQMKKWTYSWDSAEFNNRDGRISKIIIKGIWK